MDEKSSELLLTAALLGTNEMKSGEISTTYLAGNSSNSWASNAMADYF